MSAHTPVRTPVNKLFNPFSGLNTVNWDNFLQKKTGKNPLKGLTYNNIFRISKGPVSLKKVKQLEKNAKKVKANAEAKAKAKAEEANAEEAKVKAEQAKPVQLPNTFLKKAHRAIFGTTKRRFLGRALNRIPGYRRFRSYKGFTKHLSNRFWNKKTSSNDGVTRSRFGRFFRSKSAKARSATRKIQNAWRKSR